MSAKSKSTLSETPNSKASPAAPRVSIKTSKGTNKSNTDSASPLQNSRASVDQSPKPVAPKKLITTPDKRSPKLPSPADKKPARVIKPSELNRAQEDLKRAKETLSAVQKEKDNLFNELKEAKKLSEEANEKLNEALIAQKRAEEDSEIEKFQSVDVERSLIEQAQRKKEEEWLQEIEDVRSQHVADVASLLSATEELHKVKKELAVARDAKDLALSHAEEATKLSELNAEKLESLSAELARSKSSHDSRVESVVNERNELMSELETEVKKLRHELEEANEKNNYASELENGINSLRQELERANTKAKNMSELEMEVEQLRHELEKAKEKNNYVSELETEVKSLRQELEEAKKFEEMLEEKEAFLEELNVDLEAAKISESYSRRLIEELHERVGKLEVQTERAKETERSASESLESVTKQLEESNDSLRNSLSEIASLKEKVGSLEIAAAEQKTKADKLRDLLESAEEEASLMEKKVEALSSELEAVRGEKARVLEKEKAASESVHKLLEEKTELMNAVEKSRDEEEKSKKAMESLSSELHEVSSEAREAKEKLLKAKIKQENYEKRIEDMGFLLKTTKEKYEGMLEESRREIEALTSSIERSKHEHNMKEELESKEIHLMNTAKKSESLEDENTKLNNSLKLAEEEARDSKEQEDRWRSSFKEAESEVIYVKKVIGEAKDESMRLKEALMEKENELINVLRENEELRRNEADSREKIEELNKQLEEETKKRVSGELSESERDYDMLPKVVEFSEQNGTGVVKPTKEKFLGNETESHRRASVINGAAEESEIGLKMWESCKIEEKDFRPEGDPEQESTEDDLELRAEINPSAEDGDDFGAGPQGKENGSGQKKKKRLLRKFGSLLKRKSPGPGPSPAK